CEQHQVIENLVSQAFPKCVQGNDTDRPHQDALPLIMYGNGCAPCCVASWKYRSSSDALWGVTVSNRPPCRRISPTSASTASGLGKTMRHCGPCCNTRVASERMNAFPSTLSCWQTTSTDCV